MNTLNYDSLLWIINSFNSLYGPNDSFKLLLKQAELDSNGNSYLKELFEADKVRMLDKEHKGYMNACDTLFFSSNELAKTILTRLGKKVWEDLQKIDENKFLNELINDFDYEKNYVYLIIFLGLKIEIQDFGSVEFKFSLKGDANINVVTKEHQYEFEYFDEFTSFEFKNGKTFDLIFKEAKEEKEKSIKIII